MTITKAIVLPDIHVPYEDTAALRAVEAYMADHRREWDRVVYLGDVLDLDCISSHNLNNLQAVEGKRIERDYKAAGVMLDRHRKAAPRAEFTWIEGNHEDRVNRYIAARPQLQGMIEVPNALDLDGRGIEWVPFWSKGVKLSIGKARFIHGRYTNKYHAHKHLERYGDNIFYGHTHDVQNITHEYDDRHSTPAAQSLGCLCGPLDWMQGAPDKWQQAFATFYFFPDGYFTYYVTRIFKARFVSPEGDIYTAAGRQKKG